MAYTRTDRTLDGMFIGGAVGLYLVAVNTYLYRPRSDANGGDFYWLACLWIALLTLPLNATVGGVIGFTSRRAKWPYRAAGAIAVGQLSLPITWFMAGPFSEIHHYMGRSVLLSLVAAVVGAMLGPRFGPEDLKSPSDSSVRP